MSPLMLGLWVEWKPTPWRFKYCWSVSLTNSVPLSDCILIGFLLWNKVFKAAVIELAVLSFRGTLQAYLANMSIMFKRYLYLSLCFERELKSARSISQTSSIFVTVYKFLGNLFLTGLCKVYVSWPDSHSSTALSLLLPPFTNFATEPNPRCVFRIVINFTHRHFYCTDSQGTSFLSVNSCEINRVYLRPFLAF